MTDPLDLDALERLAKAAIQGPWRHVALQRSYRVMVEPFKWVCRVYRQANNAAATAEYIAAMHPQQAISLIYAARDSERWRRCQHCQNELLAPLDAAACATKGTAMTTDEMIAFMRSRLGNCPLKSCEQCDSWRAIIAQLEQVARLTEERDALRTACLWAERQLSALVTEDNGCGVFTKATRGMELAGFGVGREALRAALARTAAPKEQP